MVGGGKKKFPLHTDVLIRGISVKVVHSFIDSVAVFGDKRSFL